MALDATAKDLEQDHKIALLQGSVNTLNSAITALNARLDTHSSDIGVLAGRLRSMTLGQLIIRALGFR